MAVEIPNVPSVKENIPIRDTESQFSNSEHSPTMYLILKDLNNLKRILLRKLHANPKQEYKNL